MDRKDTNSWINGPFPSIDLIFQYALRIPSTGGSQASSLDALTMTSLLPNGMLPINKSLSNYK